MKPFGVVKKVDHLGRILIPKELRNAMHIQTDDPFEIFVDDSAIILKKYEPSCMFCNSSDNVMQFKGKNICEHCRKELQDLK